MAPTMEQLGRHVAEWRAILLDKGLKVNAGKSKVMVGSSGGKMIVHSGKWPYRIFFKQVSASERPCKSEIHVVKDSTILETIIKLGLVVCKTILRHTLVHCNQIFFLSKARN